jgi:hypothetical protein
MTFLINEDIFKGLKVEAEPGVARMGHGPPQKIEY